MIFFLIILWNLRASPLVSVTNLSVQGQSAEAGDKMAADVQISPARHEKYEKHI